MKRYNRYNKQNILPLNKPLSVQDVYGQKREARFEFRLPVLLDEMIDKVVEEKQDYSKADLTIILWLDYLSKTGKLTGKIKMKSVEELKEDVEHFIKYVNKKCQ